MTSALMQSTQSRPRSETGWQSEVKKALNDQEVSAKLQEIGIIPVGNSASQMADTLRTETQDVNRLMKELGIEPN